MLTAHRFAHYPRVTVARSQQLASFFSDMDAAWHANEQMLQEAGWSVDAIKHFCAWKKTFDEEKAEQILAQEQMQVITKNEDGYPALLKKCKDAPFALFVRGELPVGSTLAIVGSRNVSPYGKHVTTEITTALARAGVTIVSGLALGVDGLAHQATVEVGGKTIAVLGGGINRAHIAPGTHNALAETIIATGGALISEYPPGTKPTAYTFPARNRIVAGMSKGVLVTEAREGSGALITASKATEYHRPIFAVPHPLTNENGKGTNSLLKQGARVVTDVQDVLETLGIVPSEKITQTIPVQLSAAEEIIVNAIKSEPVHIDELTKMLPLDGSEIASTLVMMELSGYVKDMGGKMYISCI